MLRMKTTIDDCAKCDNCRKPGVKHICRSTANGDGSYTTVTYSLCAACDALLRGFTNTKVKERSI
jgi:hypothetical protein